jgi:hypothetical protein
MSFTITIQGTEIQFPASSESPNWSEAIDQFATSVEAALSGLAGAFDVPPQVYVIDSFNPVTDQALPNFAFPVTDVRSIYIRYAVFRTTSTTTAYETGNIMAIYSPDNPVNNKWDFSVDRVGDGQITFSITDAGQIQFSTQTLGGINHAGKITATAQAVLQND